MSAGQIFSQGSLLASIRHTADSSSTIALLSHLLSLSSDCTGKHVVYSTDRAKKKEVTRAADSKCKGQTFAIWNRRAA